MAGAFSYINRMKQIIIPTYVAESSINNDYFFGFDYLRIIFSLFIVAWHTKILGKDQLFYSINDIFVPSVSDVIYCNIFLVAVPLFLLVSLFLYAFNRKKNNYLKGRLVHLGFLYLFWTLTYMAISPGGINPLRFLKPTVLVSGNASVTYFLFNLMLMTIIVEGLIMLRDSLSKSNFALINIGMLVVSCLIMISESMIPRLLGYQPTCLVLSYYSPLNFIPYPFLALYLYGQYNKNNKKIFGRNVIVLLFTLTIFLSVCEWILLPNNITFNIDGIVLPSYSRLSMVTSSMLLFSLFINFNLNGGRIINLLAEMTLGIFLSHQFVNSILNTIWPQLSSITGEFGFLQFVAVTILSFGIVYSIKKIGIV